MSSWLLTLESTTLDIGVRPYAGAVGEQAAHEYAADECTNGAPASRRAASRGAGPDHRGTEPRSHRRICRILAVCSPPALVHSRPLFVVGWSLAPRRRPFPISVAP